MAEPTVLVGGEVKGDITSCKIESKVVAVDRKGLFSFSQKQTNVSYDVCNKQIVKEFVTPAFTSFGFIVTGFGLFAILIILVALWNEVTDQY